MADSAIRDESEQQSEDDQEDTRHGSGDNMRQISGPLTRFQLARSRQAA